jgi:hypothetical protein
MAASSRAAEIMASVSVCVSASSLESMPAMRNMWHVSSFLGQILYLMRFPSDCQDVRTYSD